MLRSGNPWPSKLIAHVSASVRRASATRPQVFKSFSKHSQRHHAHIGVVALGPSLLRRVSKVHSVTGQGAERGGEALLLRGVLKVHECEQSQGCCTLG